MIGKEESHERDSFAEPGLLDHPALHAARGVPRDGRARGPPLGRSRRGRAMAARGGAGEGHAQPARSRLALSGRVEARWYPCSPAMNTTDLVEQSYLRKGLPQFRPGDTVKVHVRVVEGNRERVQVFQGVVIRRSGGGLRETFTVRKISFGVGVERTFPLHSPSIAKLEIAQRGHVRRAKLYYLRDLRGKKARIKERRIDEAKLAAMEAMARRGGSDGAPPTPRKARWRRSRRRRRRRARVRTARATITRRSEPADRSGARRGRRGRGGRAGRIRRRGGGAGRGLSGRHDGTRPRRPARRRPSRTSPDDDRSRPPIAGGPSRRRPREARTGRHRREPQGVGESPP